ncbi:MAG TPA: hypothetical protein VFB23_00910 [Candidatus Acidoferrales bacterium]|nr:hypothetical protein [Candidatus Acidoferrales bacterium]
MPESDQAHQVIPFRSRPRGRQERQELRLGERPHKLGATRASEIFWTSDAQKTKAYYAALAKRGIAGDIAVNLMRAQKYSTRAKRYRGGIRGVGSFRDLAYTAKNNAMLSLCKVLDRHAAKLKISFGWKGDPDVLFGGRPSWVLYVDLPQGQVSFHAPERLSVHDYAGEWDGQHASEQRILEFCDSVFDHGLDGALQLCLFSDLR